MGQKIIEVQGVGQVAFPDTMSDESIKAVLDRDFGPNAKRPPTFGDQVKNSPIGGFVRGLRDLPDAGAQLLTRGLEAIAPAGSDFEKYMTAERERVEAINRTAEAEYQQGWRRGQMGDSIDGGRILGNIASTVYPAGAGIKAGLSTAQLAGRGAVQGATGSVLTQPVYNTEDQGYFSQKGQQAVMGGGFGAGGAVVGNAIGTAVQGTNRANAAATAAPKARATAQVRIEPTFTGSGGGSTLGKVGPDPTSMLTNSQAELIKRGRDLGLQVTPGQASGSRALQQMEARMESNPLFSGPFNTIKANNQAAVNRAVAQGIGETADVVDSAVLAKADARLGSIFEKVADRVPKAVVGDDVVNTLATIEQDIAGVSDKALMDNPLIKRYFNIAAKGEATGRELRTLSSQLGRAAKANIKNDTEFGMALFKVKDSVDEIISRNLDEATREQFNAARVQYRNLVTILGRQNVVNPSSGNVSGPNLASALMSRDKAGYTLGKNNTPMYDAARFAQAFKPIVGDSGTATRSMQIGPTDFLLSLPTNILASAYTSAPVTAAAGAAGRGVAPNRAGDAIAEIIRRGGPAAAAALANRGLLAQ